MNRVTTQLKWTVVVVSALAVTAVFSCQALRRTATKIYPQKYVVEENQPLAPTFSGADERRLHLTITLTPLAKGFTQPTAIAFVPGDASTAVVLEKTGALKWFDLATATGDTIATLPVNTASEQGLLGIAFHPRFVENRRFFLNYTLERDGVDVSRVEEWLAPASLRSPGAKAVRVVLELEQPYANHNGGHLAFGPDGFLYVGFGDGGYRADPHHAGQDLQNLLGKMLRLDVDSADGKKGYTIPKDNPFVGRSDAKPEIYAYGLRNPWRYSFAPDGRLIVADVGQDAFEEVGFCGRGENLGWNVREARHCFEPKEHCATTGMREPFFEYGRAEGQSVTGGVVVTGKRVPGLTGRYLFGDFISGRLWALQLPEASFEGPVEAAALGKWPILPVSFAIDAAGDAVVLDFSGNVFRIDP